ncbi:MAG: proprotein convertase P-domain-containing protein [Saprospiraceae bacterium]
MVPRIYSQNNAFRLSALLLFLFASITSFGQNPPSFVIPGSNCPVAAAVTIPMGATEIIFSNANIEMLLGSTAVDPDGDVITYSASPTSVDCSDIAGGPVMITVTATDDEGVPMTAACGPIAVTVTSAGGATQAICMDITVSLDGTGAATINAADIDNSSTACVGPIVLAIDDDADGLSPSPTGYMVACADTGVVSYTLIVTDFGGNTSTCSANVTIVDDTPPTFTCPLDQMVTLEPTAPCTMTIPDLTGSLAPMDNCSSMASDYTITQTPAAASTVSSSDGATQDVLISVKDKSGNETTCTVTLTGDDTTNPNAIAPGTALSVMLDGTGNYSLDGADSLFLINGNIDNCGTVNATISDVMFDCADIATNPNMISVTLDDGNGNTAAPYMVSINVSDAVQADTIANMEVINAAGQCSQTVIIPGSTTDNCTSGTVSNVMATDFKGNPITVTANAPDFDAEFPVGVSTVTYDLTDGTNVSSESFTVTVFDDEAPNVLYPSGVVLNYANCNNTVVVPNYGFLLNINDNCTGYSVDQTPAPGTPVSDVATLATGETFSVTITVTDNFPSMTNMGDSDVFVVTLNEDNTPVPNTPGAILSPVSGDCGALVVDAPYAVDACGNTICGVPFPLPTGTVNLGPTCGTSGVCTTTAFDIPLVGSTAIPDNNGAGIDFTFDVPNEGLVDDVIIELDATHTWVGDLRVTLTSPDGTTAVLFNRPGNPASTFGCAGDNLTDVIFSDNAAADDFEDICGNAPAITGEFQPADPFTIFTDVPSDGTWTLNVSDNAGGDTGNLDSWKMTLCIKENNSTITPDYQFPVGTHNITWTYDGGNGNIVNQQQAITVTNDGTPPVLNCASDITLELDENGNASIDGATLLGEGFSVGGGLSLGTYCITPSATDETTITFDWSFTTLDFSAGFDPFGYSVDGNFTQLTNNVGPLAQSGTETVVIPAGEEFCFVQTNDFIDAATTVVSILPGLSGDFEVANWTATGPTNYIAPDITDNCGVDFNSISTFNGSFDCDDVGNGNFVTTSAQDINSLTGFCSTNVTIVDNISPTLSGVPADVTVNCNAVPSVETGITADDNCSVVGIVFNETSTQVINPAICEFYNYQITRTWSATDVNGNLTEESQVITVQDVADPIFDSNSFPNTVAANASAGSCNAFVSLELTASDVLDLPGCVSFSDLTITNNGSGAGDADASGTYPVGSTPVTFTVTDPCGNSNTYTVNINVTDNTPPIAACNSIIVGIPNGQDSIIIDAALINLIDNGSFDNCSPTVDLDVFPNVFYCSQIADGTQDEFDITLSVSVPGSTDTTFCETTIIIQDNNDPILTCVDPLIITLEADGTATATAAMLNGGIDDCSDIMTIELTGNTAFDLTDIGSHPISDGITPTLQVTDIHGNVGTCTPNTLIVTPPTTCFTSNDVTANGEVEIPYTTTNFTNVIGFQFSMQVDDETVATFAQDNANNLCGAITLSVPNLSGIHQNLICNGTFTNQISADGKVLSVSWFNTSPDPISIPNGETLFNFRLNALGVVGDMTTFSVTGTPYTNELTTKYGNDILEDVPPLCINPIGFFEVGDNATLPISGNVSTWSRTRIDTIGLDTISMMPLVTEPILDTVVLVAGQGLANASLVKIEELLPLISNSPDTTDTDMTDGNGDYTIQVSNVAGGVALDLVPRKNNPNWLNNGDVNSSDLFFIQQHIVNNIPFTSIYDYVAADVNQSQSITTLDLVLIQDVIVNPEISPVPSSVIDAYNPWRFIKKEDAELLLDPYDLNPAIALPAQPMAPPVPSANRVYNPAVLPMTDVDWVAVKVGQIFGGLNTNTLTTNDVDSRTGENLVMSVENQKVTNGELISIPVYAKDYAAFIAWQFTLEFDENYLAYEGMTAGAIDGFEENKLGLNAVEEGIIGALWYGTPNTVKSDEVLFTLQFRALDDADALSGLINISSRTVKSQSSLISGATGEVSLAFFAPTATSTTDFELHQNRPNPFNGETLISFNLPEAGFAKVTISDISGRTLKVLEGDFAKGYNEVRIQSNDLSSTGVLYYQLESAEHIATKKMIILN